LKAAGLFSLPDDWTPAFAVIIPSDAPLPAEESEIRSASLQTEYFREALSPLFNRSPRRLIVRSSASSEEIECRGWLESKQCDPSPEDVARVVSEVLGHGAPVVRNTTGAGAKMVVVVQEFKAPRLYGHLSNERRVTHHSNRWLCEIETPTVAGAPKLSWFNVALTSRRTATRALHCSNEPALERALEGLAGWSLRERVRCHFEWVWDGERLWVVQRDIETTERGEKPSSSATSVLFKVGDPKLRIFADGTRTSKAWAKAESLRVFAAAGLPKAKLFALEEPRILSALSKGKTPRHLESDLRAILESPAVIRTDFITRGDKPAFLSPRSETLHSPEEALDWLKRNAEDIMAKGVKPGNFCFLMHRYIAASVGAFGLARPGNTRVRIDSTWGLPDGLFYFPHDSFEVDTAGRGQIVRHVRCKPFYLTSTASGAWTRQKCFAPWDWRASLTDQELRDIANYTKQVSEFLRRPVEVMFFVGVDPKTAYPPILPWIHILDLPEKPKEAADLYYAGKPFTVSNEVDLVHLRGVMARERESSKVYIRLQPPSDLLRSKEFVSQVAATANELKVPVQLEGSILSHIYYMLTKQNVRVRCADPFLPARRQRFGKLVRDLVPVTIEARGERVRTVTVPKEELAKLLKVKALEEAFELFWETDSAKSFEEMADIMEVVLSACKAYGRDFGDLVKLAEKKRKERGGFERGVVLVETAHVPLIGDDDEELALFGVGAEANPSPLGSSPSPSKLSASFKPSRKPRARGKEIAIPLIPPTVEDAGKEYVITLPDDQHELVVRYTTKELIATLRPKSQLTLPNNQMEFDFVK
jgi:predicted house-cleaning noncanonical NTP pyrophosphatase (MazG superfamily)